MKKNNKSFYHLAQRVLKEQKKPMHYKNIAQEIVKIKPTKGKTPERTVMAVLIRDTHNVFQRRGNGIFGLTSLAKTYENEAQQC